MLYKTFNKIIISGEKLYKLKLYNNTFLTCLTY